jgi:Protein of unknown function (DUF4242)
MNDMAPHLACYLVEWYRADLSEETIDRALAQLIHGVELMSANRTSPKVLMTLSVPTDDVMFCVFAAPSSEVVAEACDRAGLPAERVTAAVATPFT